MAFQDVGVEVGTVAAANGPEKVRNVALGFAGKGADKFAVLVKQRRGGNETVGSFEDPTASEVRPERRRSDRASRRR